jgi:hypothetical protein
MTMKLVMTLLVRDAEELLKHNLEFHLRQGVDFFIITDNRSVDGTSAIIQEYVRAGLAERIWEAEDTFSQGRWVTRMARLAATAYGADWVINSDDDEFWSGRPATLREVLSRVPPEWEAVEVQRRNHPAVAGRDAGEFIEVMIYRERDSFNLFGEPLLPKVCHRAMADVKVEQGNHFVSRAGVPLAALKSAGALISHFPIRGYAAFERKIVNGGSAYARNTELGPETGATWRHLYELWKRGELLEWYERQRLAPEQVLEKLANGALVIDNSILRTLRPATKECLLAE